MKSPGLAAIVSKHFAPIALICIVQLAEPSAFLVYVVVQESSNWGIILYIKLLFLYIITWSSFTNVKILYHLNFVPTL